MELPDCVTLPFFDMTSYLQETLKLSVFLYVWQLPGTTEIRSERYLPVAQSKTGWRNIAALTQWAARTDPDNLIRLAYVKLAWEQRPAGENRLIIF